MRIRDTKSILRIMSISLMAGLLSWGTISSAQTGSAQGGPPEPKSFQIVKPITEMRSALGVTYPEGPTIGIKFMGTEKLPQASGEAKVERKHGMTEIEIELDEMKPATYFGGDIATYVLWAVSPEGHVTNAGEFVLEGNRSKLNVSTPLETFGMFITAEPHFLVRTPSRLVVLQNIRPAGEISGQMMKFSNVSYRGFEGIYQHDSESLENMNEAEGEIRGDVKEARVAVELAKRAGAEQFATDELKRALASHEKTIAAAEANVDAKQLMLQAHETVRLALEAQVRAEERAMQAALNEERNEHASEINDLEMAIGKAQSETERAELLARQRDMQLQLEQDARMRAQADAQRAWDEAQRARQEREEARAKMQQALSKVVETRMTARGLIMNVPDILFEFNKASLKPEARETLSRVCGILQVAEGYKLGFEGHTDSVGSDEYNQTLSEDRAQSVRDYLVSCGQSPDIMTTRGFVESQPIASNDTEDGRQKNRRVEIVLEEEEDFHLSYVR